MTYRRPQVNRDHAHPIITAELEQAGFSVADLAAVGEDKPDIAIGRSGITMLVEIKSDKKIRHTAGDGRKPGQKRFADEWRGSPIIVAETSEQIIHAFDTELYRLCNRTTALVPRSTPLQNSLATPRYTRTRDYPPADLVRWDPVTRRMRVIQPNKIPTAFQEEARPPILPVLTPLTNAVARHQARKDPLPEGKIRTYRTPWSTNRSRRR